MTTAPQVVGVGSGAGRRDVLLVVATSMVIGVLALAGFSAAHGVENRLFAGAPAVPPTSTAVDRVVLQQEAQGLVCRAEPMLAARVVFQYVGADAAGRQAVVLDFDDAVAALRSGAGSIQRYCS